MRIPGFGPRRPVLADAATGRAVVLERRPGESVEAFEQRRAAYQRDHAVVAPAAPLERDRRHGYDEGRRDQHKVEKVRRKRGGFGLISVLMVLIAALGALWLYLAAREGSFAAGGAVVDEKVAEVTSPARAAANQAADRTGAVVQNAGQALETSGERLRQTAQPQPAQQQPAQ